jgi:hypothetical protein
MLNTLPDTFDVVARDHRDRLLTVDHLFRLRVHHHVVLVDHTLLVKLHLRSKTVVPGSAAGIIETTPNSFAAAPSGWAISAQPEAS